jgi:hypothetical protein
MVGTTPWRTGALPQHIRQNLFGQNEDGVSRRALLDGDQNVTSTILPEVDKQVDFGSITRPFTRAYFEELLGQDATGTPRRALLAGGDYATAIHSLDEDYATTWHTHDD